MSFQQRWTKIHRYAVGGEAKVSQFLQTQNNKPVRAANWLNFCNNYDCQ